MLEYGTDRESKATVKDVIIDDSDNGGTAGFENYAKRECVGMRLLQLRICEGPGGGKNRREKKKKNVHFTKNFDLICKIQKVIYLLNY